jgi:hypothetical protein
MANAVDPDQRSQRIDAFNADARLQDLMTALLSATPAQVANYVTNNVTDLPSARVLLTKILLLLATR